jgi:hypothetical protein
VIFLSNATVRAIRRVNGINRYGGELRIPVYSNVPVHLEERSTFLRVADGDSQRIDAEMLLPVDVILRAGDFLELEAPREEEYIVFTADQPLDPFGRPDHTHVTLVKKRQEN